MGGNPNCTDADGRTLLEQAVCPLPRRYRSPDEQKRQVSIVQALIKAGADVNAVDNEQRTVLHKAIINRTDAELWDALLHDGAEINRFDSDGETLLLTAVMGDDADALQWLLKAGTWVNGTDFDHRTALHWAVSQGRVGMLPLLFSAGIDVNAKTRWEETALHMLGRPNVIMPDEDQRVVVDPLINHGINVNAETLSGETAMERADRLHQKTRNRVNAWVTHLLARQAKKERSALAQTACPVPTVPTPTPRL